MRIALARILNDALLHHVQILVSHYTASDLYDFASDSGCCGSHILFSFVLIRGKSRFWDNKSGSTIKEHLATLKKAGVIKRVGSGRDGEWLVLDGVRGDFERNGV